MQSVRASRCQTRSGLDGSWMTVVSSRWSQSVETSRCYDDVLVVKIGCRRQRSVGRLFFPRPRRPLWGCALGHTLLVARSTACTYSACVHSASSVPCAVACGSSDRAAEARADVASGSRHVLGNREAATIVFSERGRVEGSLLSRRPVDRVASDASMESGRQKFAASLPPGTRATGRDECEREQTAGRIRCRWLNTIKRLRTGM